MCASSWYQKPLRILQTVLRDVDAKDYDADAVVAYMKRARCNVLVVNAGGIVDFFPNPLRFANPSPFLGAGDVLGQAAEACRRAGFHVLGRVDFRGVTRAVYDAHPEAFAAEEDGGPTVMSFGETALCRPCYNGHYLKEHAGRLIAHLMERYPLSGIWQNAVQWVGACHCSACAEAYRKETGLPIPAKGSEDDTYRRVKRAWARAHLADMQAAVKRFGPDKAYVAEVFGPDYVGRARASGIDQGVARAYFDFAVTPAFLTGNEQNRSFDDFAHASSVVRFLKALNPGREAVLLFGTNGSRHRYVADPPDDERVWMWQAFAAGASLWNAVYYGQHPEAAADRRNAFLAEPVYRLLEEHEPLLAGRAPMADAAVLYSAASCARFAKDHWQEDAYVTAVRGMESVLEESHVQYASLDADDLSAEALQDLPLLVLPNAACLSDAQCELIRGYVRDGGGLLATFETSLCDEHGAYRRDFALADLFGCSFAGERADTRHDCFQRIVDRHEILAGLERTEMLVNHGTTLLCSLKSDLARVLCAYIPVIPNRPPDMTTPAPDGWEHPTLVVHPFGRGRVVYFANQPDRSALMHGHPDFRHLLARAARCLLAGRERLTTNAPESVSVTLTRTPRSEYILTLVNCTSAPVRPLRSLVPVRDIEITLHLGRPLRHRALRSEGNISFRRGKDHDLVIAVQRLDECCVIHLRPESSKAGRQVV